MKLKEFLTDNSVFIIPRNIKDKFIKIVNNYPLINIRIITIEELSKKLIFDYNEKTIHFLMNYKNISYKNACEYIKNLYYITEDYNNDKVSELKSIKKLLEENDLLIYDNLFIKSIKNKKIYIYGFDNINKFDKYLISKLGKTTFIEEDVKIYKHEVINFRNINEEIEYIANDILNNIKNGVDLNNIFIANYNTDYNLTIKRIFNMYNIPINLDDNISLYDTREGISFINNLHNYKEFLVNIDNNEIHDLIISIMNKYYWVTDKENLKNLLIEEFKKQKLNTTKYKNAVNTIEIVNNIINDDDYIYFIGFADAYIPKLYKDNDFFTDSEKNCLQETTSEKNKIEKEIWVKAIEKIKNIKITYASINLKSPLRPSPLINNFEIIEGDYVASIFSHKSNEFNLALLTDELNLYDTVHKEINKLKFNYKNSNYLTYNNKYKQINSELINNHFSKQLNLSYTRLNSYFQCSFKYYLESILKLSVYEERFETYLGNLSHHILSKAYNSDFDFEKEQKSFLNNNYYELTNENKVFLKKMMEELKDSIQYLKDHYKDTLYKTIETEKEVIIEKDNVTFRGFIDKIMIHENSAVIVDYKTFVDNPDLTVAHYGLKFQLPIYAFLVKQIYPEVSIAGIFLQGITRTILNHDPKKTIEQMKKENSKLVGYILDNENIVENFDCTYQNSEYIKSMKTTSKGFSHYSKTLNEKQFEGLSALAEKKINEAILNIKSANFTINPKIVDRKNLSCTYCKYKSICFVNYDNYVYLKSDKNLSFLGGEENAMD